MLAICTAILIAAALYFAKSIFAPFAFAIFMMAIVWPAQNALQNKLSEFAAVFLTLIATVLVIVAFGAMVAWSFSVVAEWMIATLHGFRSSISNGPIGLKSMTFWLLAACPSISTPPGWCACFKRWPATSTGRLALRFLCLFS